MVGVLVSVLFQVGCRGVQGFVCGGYVFFLRWFKVGFCWGQCSFSRQGGVSLNLLFQFQFVNRVQLSIEVWTGGGSVSGSSLSCLRIGVLSRSFCLIVRFFSRGIGYRFFFDDVSYVRFFWFVCVFGSIGVGLV